MVHLRGELYQVAMVRWVDIPKRELASLEFPPAENKGWNALLRFNDDVDRVTLFAGKRGHYKLAFKVELLRAADVDAGDTIEFSLEPDGASREPGLPEEMSKVFRDRPALAKKWFAHSVAQRRQVLRYIEQAKTAETVSKRCWLFLDRLDETGKLSAD